MNQSSKENDIKERITSVCKTIRIGNDGIKRIIDTFFKMFYNSNFSAKKNFEYAVKVIINEAID